MNFPIISKPPTSGDQREMYRWQYIICEVLNGIRSIFLEHDNTQSISIVDDTDTNNVTPQHLTNAKAKVYGDHVRITNGNPHGTDHSMLDNIGTLDPTSIDTVKDKHLSNAQGKVWQDITNITGILKGNGSAISAATANTDYVPATSGANYLKLDNTGVSSKGDLAFFTPDGNSSFQLNNSSLGVNLSDGGTSFMYFTANSTGGFGCNTNENIQMTTLTLVYMLAGGCGFLMSTDTGFYVSDETGANTITLTAAGMAVTAPLVMFNDKIAMTPEGGFAVRYTNRTGGASVKGHVVTVSAAYNNAVKKIVVNVPDPIGVIYEDGIADGQEVWVVVSGTAEVYFIGSTTRGHLARGFVTGDTGYVTGQALSEAVPTSPFATDKHFYEIGHVQESRTGAGLAKCTLHFN